MNVLATWQQGDYDHCYTYAVVSDSIEEIKAELETDEYKFDDNLVLDIPHEIHSPYDCTGELCSESYSIKTFENFTIVVLYRAIDV